MNTPYGFGTPLPVPYEEAIPRVKEALKAEGFGVLTEIDVRQTLREKLGAGMEPYIILGGLQSTIGASRTRAGASIGLLLPCNVVIRAQGQGSRVDIADPLEMLGMVGNSNSIPSPRKRDSGCNVLLPRSVSKNERSSSQT